MEHFASFKSSLQGITAVILTLATATTVSAAVLYDSGDPSAGEQYILERINTARANPPQEGVFLTACTDPTVLEYFKYYNVDLNAVRSQFAGYAAKPPLAMNKDLMASALKQSLDQAATGIQSHVGSDGSQFFQRINSAGYNYSAAGENVYAYVTNPLFGHVGLNVDWGVPSLDHRVNLMNYGAYVFKEVGISLVSTSIPNFGPEVLTQDFGTASDPTQSFLVGVVYNDQNGNGSYDAGEGLAGVTVTLDQGDYYAVTSTSGGYTIPLPAGVTQVTVTATGGGLGAARVQTVAVANQNVKVDFTSQQSPAPLAATVPNNQFFSGNVALQGGWNYLAWLGYYNTNNFPVLYHQQLGFQYYMDAADGQGGAMLYDFTSQAWRYTSPTLFPYFYDFGANSWVYYFTGTSNPRQFANLSTGQIVQQ